MAEPDAAFTIGEYGSTFEMTREGTFVNGEPYNPDEDGVHQPGPGAVKPDPRLRETPDWGETLFISGSDDTGWMAHQAGMIQRLGELEAIMAMPFAPFLPGSYTGRLVERRKPTPRWAHVVAWALVAGAVLGKLRR